MKSQLRVLTVCVAVVVAGAGWCTFARESMSADSDTVLSLANLLNIEVTIASKSSEKRADAPGIISVITSDELKRFGGTTLRDVLERVPSLISAAGGYTNRSSIVIRGDLIKQNSSHILLLVNGRPIREVQEGGLSADVVNGFPVNIIERIEIIRGPGSVLYGSDAFSGVINIITVHADKNSIAFTQYYQADGGLKSAGEAFLKVGDLQLVAAGQYYNKPVWSAPHHTATYTFVPATLEFVVGDTLINVDIPDQGKGLFLGVGFKGFRFDATYNEWATDNLITFNEVKNTKYFANAGYSHTINDNWNMDVNFTYSQARFLGTGYMKRNSHYLMAEWTNFISFGEKINLAIGGLFNRIDGTETVIFNPDSIYNNSKGRQAAYAAYAQIDYQPAVFLKVIAGSQLNKVGDLKSNLVPRFGFIVYPVDRISIKALYSEAYKAPTINELYLNTPDLMLGNKNLRPEKVSTYDLGIGFQGENVHVGANAFYSKLKDIIQPRRITETLFERQYQNISKATFMGVEVESEYYLNKNLYFNASILYQTNKDDSTENLTPLANLGVKAGISYRWERGISVSLFDIYQGDPDDKYIVGLNPDQGAYNLLHFHSEFKLNTLFDMFAKPGISFLFNVDNMLDKKVYMYEWGGINIGSIPTNPGRALYGGLKIEFN